MRYAAGVTIPANTTEADPHEETLDLCYGRIREVSILFPAGHAGTTHLQIFYQTHQIFPTTPGESFTGDDTVHSFPENLEIHEVPHEVMLRGWNDSTENAHTIYVMLSVLLEEITTPVISAPVALPEGMIL